MVEVCFYSLKMLKLLLPADTNLGKKLAHNLSSLITAAFITPSQQGAESLLEPAQRSRFVERTYLDMRLP
jgi:hypothetical protein